MTIVGENYYKEMRIKQEEEDRIKEEERIRIMKKYIPKPSKRQLKNIL